MSSKPKTTKSDPHELGEMIKGVKTPTPQVFDIHIASDGTWYHEGGEIRRPALVKLFASVLQRADDGSFWLVTPVERGSITVADAPFLATAVTVTGSGAEQQINFSTNVGDAVTLSAAHPLQMRVPPKGDGAEDGADDGADEGLAPYVTVRGSLEARVVRPVFYELAELAVESDGAFGVWSAGQFFSLEE
ncbi:DUF1285 domain-containing protein [Alphaproteobacteria bacterium]|nr:DUF1285 domain-containing protein [Alphaproteobacteria bacterium]